MGVHVFPIQNLPPTAVGLLKSGLGSENSGKDEG